MNPIWLPASLFGGLFQAWRTALQQRLRAELSVSGAGLVRYLYGLPFALCFAAIWLTMRGDAVPAFGTAFAGFAIAGALKQMAGTILLIMAFGNRGFVVVIGRTSCEDKCVQNGENMVAAGLLKNKK